MVKNAFAVFGFLAVLLMSLAIVSADVTFSPTELSGTGDSGTTVDLSLTISNTYSGDLLELSVTFSDLTDGSNTITASNLDISQINDTAKIPGGEDLEVVLNIQIPSGQAAGTYEGEMNLSGAITASPSHRGTVNITIIVTEDPTTPTTSETLCELEGYTENGDLEVADFDVNNNGEGKDDEWQYLDEIEIIVEIKNTHNNEDIKDVEVMIVIMDNKIENGGNDVTNDFEFDDEVLTSIGKLKDGDKEEVTFLINELPSDLDDGTYFLYIMAYEDGNEGEQCESKSTRIDNNEHYFEFSVESVDDDEAVIAKKENFATSINTYCGQQNLEIKIPIYNLGDDKEEKVLVKIFNSEMGIDEYKIINNLRDGDKEELTFFIDIPEGISEEKYNIGVSVHFDWDEDQEEDEQSSYDKRTLGTPIYLEILSCQGPDPTITANLESEAKIGEELIIKTIVTNNGEENDFIISTSGVDSWASVISVTPQTVSIEEGEFAEVIIKLMPTKSGTQSFNIETIVDGESTSQAVTVNIAEEPKLFGEISDTVLYIIAGIVALLILIFLALIIRVSRRSVKPQF